MRLWHKDLIPYLPRQQLLGQWRECCCIAKNITIKGTPNHILVNKVMSYPFEHLYYYTLLVRNEMVSRGYKCKWNNFDKYNLPTDDTDMNIKDIYSDWHNDRYFWQCFYNLQEKYDCGGITDEEWGMILDGVNQYGR